jgi:hypothetical protein
MAAASPHRLCCEVAAYTYQGRALRKSDGFLFFTGGCLLLLGFIFVHAGYVTQGDLVLLKEESQVVQNLGLTDLCLFTEARHTRHPSQADWHTAFQSHAQALDHFPSGSIIGPPETLKQPHD